MKPKKPITFRLTEEEARQWWDAVPHQGGQDILRNFVLRVIANGGAVQENGETESLTHRHVTSATVIDGYDAAMPVGIAPGDFPIVRQLRDLLNSEQRAMAIDIIAAMHKRLDDNALGEQRTGTEAGRRNRVPYF